MLFLLFLFLIFSIIAIITDLFYLNAVNFDFLVIYSLIPTVKCNIKNNSESSLNDSNKEDPVSNKICGSPENSLGESLFKSKILAVIV